MNISERKLKEYQIFDVSGNIPFEETQNMENFIYSTISPELKKVVINLAEVPYLNSSALGSLVRILQALKSNGTVLYIMNVNKDISNLFVITGVNKYFQFIADEKAL